MLDHRIQFDKLPWENTAPGAFQKKISAGGTVMRLLRFEDNFIEEHWCTKVHHGFVLDGKMTIDFNGSLEYYIKGDGLWIEGGESSKHKVIIAKGTFVELILFESK